MHDCRFYVIPKYSLITSSIGFKLGHFTGPQEYRLIDAVAVIIKTAINKELPRSINLHLRTIFVSFSSLHVLRIFLIKYT